MATSTNATNGDSATYFFQIHGLQPLPDKDTRRDSRDRWLPPKKEGSNRLLQFEGQPIPVKLMFYHDGASTTLLGDQQVAALRTRAVPYKTYSLYHARGVFWIVDYDVTRHKVGDGKHDEDDADESSSGDEDNGAYDDWSELTFGPANIEEHPFLSYAGHHQNTRRLLAQRRGQDWVQHLIPDRYQSHFTATDGKSGGLVGELPLLIGLAAMSLPVQGWPGVLPQTIVNPPQSRRSWRISQVQKDHVDRGTQWIDKRGVLVKVFRDVQGSSEDELEQYEHGVYGPILA
ncbi:hypothetical protein PRZ48_007527 [Zasmidium cellare]|uniref:Uncharacterized protein n=1 Tax=Zasmidium cellare TaxID=395010 RepID=A0ABR0EKQ6_ZASCE|nr:hypothetical protein PRZ48_007527 [Zasmidium cellare]